jgi:hypothetical protein
MELFDAPSDNLKTHKCTFESILILKFFIVQKFIAYLFRQSKTFQTKTAKKKKENKFLFREAEVRK